jgi:hypothetical protein
MKGGSFGLALQYRCHAGKKVILRQYYAAIYANMIVMWIGISGIDCPKDHAFQQHILGETV